MTNLGFLTYINASIFKSEKNNKYYVRIPFITYNSELSYIENFDNSIFIMLNEDLVNNDDLEEFIKLLDDRYEFYTLENVTEDTIAVLNNIHMNNYSYFSNLNNIIDIEIDEDDVKHTNQTFMNILKQTYVYNNLEPTDYLYKYVIDFYANGQYDDAIILMNSIFNGEINVGTQTSTCGCNQQVSNCSGVTSSTNSLNTGTELINYDKASCLDKYKAAIYQWLQKMLSDIEFYCHWLFIDDENGNSIPNEVILNKLIELLQFLLDNYDLSTLGNSSSSYCNHKSSIKCDDSFIDNYGNSNNDNNACSNYTIIKNYIEALKLVKEDKVLENKNKIYIYGKKFAEIFPLLTF